MHVLGILKNKKKPLKIITSLIVIVFCSSCLITFAKGKGQDQSAFLLNYQQGLKFHKEGNLESAVLYLNNALITNPNDLLSLTELGQVLIELGKYDLAISAFQRALKIAPNDAFVRLSLGLAYQNNKQFNDAILEFKNAIMIEPDNVLIRSNLGFACQLISDYECVLDNLGKVILAYPTNLRARAALGSAYHASKDFVLAKEQYKYVLNYEPENIDILYNLSKTLLALGDLEEAKKYIDKAIVISGSQVDFYLDRAQINFKLNKPQEAESDYLQALKLDVLNPEIPLEYAGFLWNIDSYPKAIEQINLAINLQPDDISLLIKKAYFLQKSKNLDDAELTWSNVLAEDIANQTALFNLAKLYQEKKDYIKAIEYYKKLLSKKEEDDLQAKTNLAYCLHKSKNLSESRLIYDDILSKKNEDPLVLYNYGVLLIEQNEYKLAIDYLEKSIKNKFVSPGKAYKALVDVCTNLNDTEKIKSSYQSWLSFDKNNTEARMAYAKFLARAGDTKAAIDQYRTAAALDNTTKSRFKLAQFLLEQKDIHGAIAELQEYLKHEPLDLNALIPLANSYKEIGIIEEAINTYKKIIFIQAENHLAYYNLGLLYQQNNKFEEAQNSFLKALELSENYAPAYYALGISYMINNNADKAKDFFQKYLKLDPNGEYKEKAETKLKELLQKPISSQPKA